MSIDYEKLVKEKFEGARMTKVSRVISQTKRESVYYIWVDDKLAPLGTSRRCEIHAWYDAWQNAHEQIKNGKV